MWKLRGADYSHALCVLGEVKSRIVELGGEGTQTGCL